MASEDEVSESPGTGARPAVTGRFLAALSLTLAAFFHPVLVGGRSFFYRDYGVLGYPVIAALRDAFWRGEFPLWNPLSNCGAPFLGQWGAMSLYPFSLIYLLLPLPWSLNLFCVLHLFWGGFGAYRLVALWTRSGMGPVFAGILFAINGVTLSCLIWPNYAVAIGWMPWTILLAIQGCRQGGLRLIYAMGASSFQLLAGVPELVVLTWFLILVLLAAQPETRRWRTAARLGVIIALSAGLIAAQFLPFWELLQHSQRSPDFSTDRWSLPVWGLGNFLAPLYHCFKTPEGIFFQPGQEFINSCYFGLISLALMGLALRAPRHPVAVAMLLLLIGTLVLAMGDQAYLYRWLRQAFPALGIARFPVKFMLLSIILVPALAAFGLDRCLCGDAKGQPKAGARSLLISAGLVMGALGLTLWRASQNPFYYDQVAETRVNGMVRAGFLAASVVALLVMARSQSKTRRGWVGMLFLLAVAADLHSHVPWQNPSLPNDDFKPGAWADATRARPPKLGEARVLIVPAAEDRLLHSPLKDLEADYVGKRIALWSNLHLIEGIPKVNGSSTLQIREEAQVQDLLYRKPRHTLPRLLDFLGVQYENDATNVLEWRRRASAMPLITAGQAVAFTNNTLSAWLSEFDPRRIVYFPEQMRSDIGSLHKTEAKIESVAFHADRVEFRCTTVEKCVVVVAQSWYPAWQAYVDGQKTPLWTANHAFQALAAPAGEHRILLVYEDRWFRVGLWISALSVAVCLALGWKWRHGLEVAVREPPAPASHPPGP